MSAVVDAERASDDYVLGDANHQLLAVGTVASGFSLWCRRCDRLGTRVYSSLLIAQACIDASKKDIAPECQPVKRSA